VIAEPTVTRCELTVVDTFGTAWTRMLSAGTPQSVVTPTCARSLGTTSTYVYHPAFVSVAGGVA
jgi:hypothetical protein